MIRRQALAALALGLLVGGGAAAAHAGPFTGRAASVRVETTTTAPPITTSTTFVPDTPVSAPPVRMTPTTARRVLRPLTPTTAAAPRRTAGEQPCPSGNWAPSC